MVSSRHARAVREGVLAVVGLLLGGGVAACGDSASDEYCEVVKAESVELAEFSEATPLPLSDVVESLKALDAASPRLLQDEWTTVVNAFSTLETAVEEAGVDPSRFDLSQPSAELSPSERRRIEGLAAVLGSARVEDAVGALSEHATTECGVELDF